MMRQTKLTAVDTHFRFGENWASFARLISPERIRGAETSFRQLLSEDLAGKSFLDIGSGSGLSALVAVRAGASPLVAIDIDPDSVRTTEAVLKQFVPDGSFRVEQRSVFDVTPDTYGKFDVVHSWGVLHHTGAMWDAVDKAADLVAPGGSLVIALYLRTPFCGFWRAEKRFYVNSSKSVQDVLFHLYRGAMRLRLRLLGVDPEALWDESKVERGMDRDHDIRDWIGGYPYESASPEEVDAFIAPKGFVKLRSFRTKRGFGLFGTGCAEYVYRKI